MNNVRDARTRRLVLLAMCSALAYVLMVAIRIPIVLFLKYDPKDVILAFAGLLFGPLASAAVSAVVSLVEMVTVSDTGIIGLVMNILSSCSFACTAALIYRRRRTMGGAVLGLVAGALLQTAAMLLWNYLLTPLYMHQPREEIAAMLLPVFLPFNLFKGSTNAALTLLLYKPAIRALRRAHLVEAPAQPQAAAKRNTVGMLAAAAAFALVCVLLLLLMKRG